MFITTAFGLCHLAFQKNKGTNNKHNFQNWICYCTQQIKDDKTELFPVSGQPELVQLTQYIELIVFSKSDNFFPIKILRRSWRPNTSHPNANLVQTRNLHKEDCSPTYSRDNLLGGHSQEVGHEKDTTEGSSTNGTQCLQYLQHSLDLG